MPPHHRFEEWSASSTQSARLWWTLIPMVGLLRTPLCDALLYPLAEQLGDLTVVRPISTYIWIRGPRALGRVWRFGGTQLYCYLLHFGHFRVWATSLGAAVGLDWAPRTPKGVFWGAKVTQSCRNIKHFIFSRADFTKLWTKMSFITPNASRKRLPNASSVQPGGARSAPKPLLSIFA